MKHARLERLTEANLAVLTEWFRDPELRRRLGPPTPAWTRHAMHGPNGLAWLAFEGGDPVGFVQIDIAANRHGSFALATRPDLRGQGVGRRILELLVEAVGSLEVSRLEGFVEPDHVASRRCLEAAGFQPLNPVVDDEGFLLYARVIGAP